MNLKLNFYQINGVQCCDINNEGYVRLKDMIAVQKARQEDAIQNETTYTIGAIGEKYGLNAVKLNRLLEDMGIQHFRSGVWHLDHKLVKKGYVTPISGRNKKTFMRWTVKGKLYIESILEEYLDNNLSE